MTFKEDPPRLSSLESNADPALRELLHAASAHAPTAAQLEALALKVGSATAMQSADPAHAANSARGSVGSAHGLLTKGALVKLAAVLVIGGAAAWLSVRSMQSNTGRADVQSAARAAAPAAPASPATVAPQATLARPTAATLAPEHPSAEARPQTTAGREPSPALAAPAPHLAPRMPPLSQPARAEPAPRASTPASHATAGSPHRAASPTRAASTGSTGSTAAQAPEPEPSVDVQPSEREKARPSAAASSASELTLLSRAQGLLAHDPQGALEALDEHEHVYPHGAFAEEREALAIDALRRLGRRQELQARARAFVARFPSSPHRERIEGWLQ